VSSAAHPARVAPARRRLPPEERRAQLLDVALRVFARSGLGQARHAEIAAEAGVAVSTVFLYFPTREALVGAVLDEVERFYLGLMDETLGRAPTARGGLEAMAEVFVASLESKLPYALVWLDWSTSFRAEYWQRFLRFTERIRERIEITIRRGQDEGSVGADRDPDSSARLFVGSAQMAVQMKLTGAGPDAIARFRRTLLDTAIGPTASRPTA
jgi:TetR/AcrR family hemagglutinin/protease transcriptional regulator